MAAATSVAVIGSGAAGLATARAFAKAFASAGPLRLDVYEQGGSIGGVWDYAAHVKTKPMYNGLRTNLPKELMGFREFPFRTSDDSYVTHNAVQSYLENYADAFGLKRYIRFNSVVKKLSFIAEEDPLKYPRLRLDYSSEGGTKVRCSESQRTSQ